jgi:hypothetical protein
MSNDQPGGTVTPRTRRRAGGSDACRASPAPGRAAARAVLATALLVSPLRGAGGAARPAATQPADPPATQPAGRHSLIGRLEDKDLAESSGIVASRRHEGVFWTHNDSGGGPHLFAVNREGKLIARFEVAAVNRDWEDVATDDDGHLYIGEIGNNGGRLGELAVYRVDEPDPRAPRGPKAGGKAPPPPPPLRVTQTWRLRFPDRPFDCEALFVHGGKGYVISKLLTYQPATIYRFDLAEQKGPFAVLEPVAAIPVRFPVTAADVTPDGRRLAVMTVGGPYLFDIDGDVATAAKAAPAHVGFVHPKIEAVCFVPEGLLATTEDRQVFLFRYEQFGVEAGPATKPAGGGESPTKGTKEHEENSKN